MNQQMQEEFYQAMTNLRRANKSRAASTQTPKEDTRVTEIINGTLVSRPASTRKEPEVIDLQEYARTGKARSYYVPTQGINKMKEIHDFIASKGTILI